jgi:hypothetical protein
MIKSIHIISELKIDELISKGFTVKVDYDMDHRHSEHSCLGCIMKDGRSIPFFDMNDDETCITELGLVGHEWKNIIGEIMSVVPFKYSGNETETSLVSEVIEGYKKESKKKLLHSMMKGLIENELEWFVIGSLISSDTVYNLGTAKKSHEQLVDIKTTLEEMNDIDVTKKNVILKRVNASIELIESEIEKYSKC